MRKTKTKGHGQMRSPMGPRRTMRVATHWLIAMFFAIATIIPAQPAFATIDNTATATGTPAAGTLTDPTDTENVDVENAAPELTTVKTADNTGPVSTGNVITYTYTVTNNGNITINAVTMSDVHSGAGINPVPGSEALLTDNGTLGDSTDGGADGSWDVLAPGDVITFTATYTVVAADITAGVDITNTATANGTPAAGTLVSNPGNETVTVAAAAPAMTITKTADDTTDVVVGQTITYTYEVTNTGNVAINGVTVSDVHGGSGPAPVPGSEILFTDNGTLGDSTDAATDGSWDTLAPLDVIRFTATYVVTQSDVDTLQ